MNLTSINPGSFFGVTSSTSSARPSTSTGFATPTADSGSSSRPAAFLNQLASMSPTDAKQALGSLADTFRSHAGGGRSALADLFQKAADTGDLSEVLQAAKGNGGAGWSRGAGAYSSTMAVTRASR